MFRSPLQKIGNYLITLSAPPPQGEPRLPSATPRDSGADAREFERRTRRLAAARQTAAKGKPAVMVAGSVQFVGMDEIKRKLGASWHSVANIAYEIAEETIKKGDPPDPLPILQAWKTRRRCTKNSATKKTE